MIGNASFAKMGAAGTCTPFLHCAYSKVPSTPCLSFREEKTRGFCLDVYIKGANPKSEVAAQRAAASLFSARYVIIVQSWVQWRRGESPRRERSASDSARGSLQGRLRQKNGTAPQKPRGTYFMDASVARKTFRFFGSVWVALSKSSAYLFLAIPRLQCLWDDQDAENPNLATIALEQAVIFPTAFQSLPVQAALNGSCFLVRQCKFRRVHRRIFAR